MAGGEASGFEIGDEDKPSPTMGDVELRSLVRKIGKKKHEEATTWRTIKGVFLLLFILSLIAAIIVLALLYGQSVFAAYIFVPLSVVLGIALLVGYFYYRSGVEDLKGMAVPKEDPGSDSASTFEAPVSKVQESCLKRVKITVLGPKGSGKSAVLRRYIDSNFEEKEPLPSNTRPNAQIKSLPGKARFEFHEAPTQATYTKPTLEMALQEAAFAILTYDISDPKSFEAAQQQLKIITPDNLPVLLLGCKSDLTRQVTYEEAEKFATENHLSFLEVSAKNDTGIRDGALEEHLIAIMNEVSKQPQQEDIVEHNSV